MVLKGIPDSLAFMIPLLNITILNLIEAVQFLRYVEVRTDNPQLRIDSHCI
jgi:hypothetical protein